MQYIIVQAGGKGSRLGYLTKNKPKALVPIDNLPMLFHLFEKFPDKKYIIIADYKRDVLHKYLQTFAKVQFQVVDADECGTCSGISKALTLIPSRQPFMLIWSDLVLPTDLVLPEDYQDNSQPKTDYIGISQSFPCRWSYKDGLFVEEKSNEFGVAGMFLFSDKSKLCTVPSSGEFVQWLGENKFRFSTIGLVGTNEYGILEEYEKLPKEKCRSFNQIAVEAGILTKKPKNEFGKVLAERERNWYSRACKNNIGFLPKIYSINPLKMEYIDGKNLYELDSSIQEKKVILKKLVDSLKTLHDSESIDADSFSLRETYFVKTITRLKRVEDLIPFARNREIIINGKACRNVLFYQRELEHKIEVLCCNNFSFIHGDCTFSNIMLRKSGELVLLDPRGYFGYTEIFGDERYDWAKLYYSLVGNYDKFNLKEFSLGIDENSVTLSIESNNWEDMEDYFFHLTGANREEIKLLHALIWLSLTTYSWQDYDSICAAFYNGLYYLEDVLWMED